MNKWGEERRNAILKRKVIQKDKNNTYIKKYRKFEIRTENNKQMRDRHTDRQLNKNETYRHKEIQH